MVNKLYFAIIFIGCSALCMYVCIYLCVCVCVCVCVCISQLSQVFIWMKEGSEKAGLKLNIQKTKIMASGPITSWQIDGETVDRLYFLRLQNQCSQ